MHWLVYLTPVLASEYKMQLPDEKRLADELVRTQAVLEEGYRRR